MQDVHTVPWGFCRREHMDATWLNFPYKMVLVKLLKCSLLVRLSNFFITVASSWFSKVINKDASCFVNRGFVWLFADQNLKRSSILSSKTKDLKHSNAVLFLHLPLLFGSCLSFHTPMAMSSISRCGIKRWNNSITFEKNPNLYRSLVTSSSNTVRSSGEINTFDWTNLATSDSAHLKHSNLKDLALLLRLC